MPVSFDTGISIARARQLRSAQCSEHLGRNLVHRTDTFDAAVLRRAFRGCQALVEVHQRLGLRMVDGQAMTHGLFLVVFALDQLIAGFVVLASNLRWVVLGVIRSEEHTSELQSLMRISYA